MEQPKQTSLFDSVNFPTTITQNNEDILNKYNIIREPDNIDTINRVTEKTIVVDSRSRNRSEFPEPNKYTIELPTEYKDVVSLQIVNYHVPSPQYNIRNSNNVFYYSEVDPEIKRVKENRYEIAYSKIGLQKEHVPIGYYTPDSTYSEEDSNTYDSLSIELNKLLSSNTSSNCNVTFNPRTLQYQINTDFCNRNASSEDIDNPSSAVFFHFFPSGPDSYSGKTETVNASSNEITNSKQITQNTNSVGPILGFHRDETDNLLQGILQMDNLGNITGIGTQFTKQLKSNDWIYVKTIDNTYKYRYQINQVSSDTQCTVKNIGGIYAFGYAFGWNGRIVSPGIRNLYKDDYIILRIGGASILESSTDSVNSAFCIIPTKNSEFEIVDNLTTTKKFNPVMGRLQKLKLSFHNPDGSPYDFMGVDHVLMFKIVRYVQNISFSNF